MIGSGFPPEEELKFILWALNGDDLFAIQVPADEQEWQHYDELRRETPHKLQHLVHSWTESGRDLQSMWHRSYETALLIDEFYQVHPLQMAWQSTGNVLVHTFLDHHLRTAEEEAARFFLTLIFNPLKDELRGPCPGCAKYFIRQTARNKTYCSRSCGARATAIAATMRKRAEDREDKLQRSRAAIRRFEQQHKNRTKVDWKKFVSMCEPDIKSNFLTRAVKQGELESPVLQ